MANAHDVVRARLKAIRLERGLTQEEVAERAGMATSTPSASALAVAGSTVVRRTSMP